MIEVQGRSDDTLRLQGRPGHGTVDVLPLALSTVLEEQAGLYDFQLVQQGPRDLLPHHSQGFVVFALGLGLTTGALWLLHASGVHGGLPELVVLTVANLAVTVMRFVLLKVWVFGVKEGAASPSYG